MALRKIITEENELLYKISKPVEKFDDKLIMLIDDMFDTMHKAKGVGLAAPQIGILRRVVVIEINNTKYELVNPVITEQSGEQIAEEGCLSIPGFYAKTRRPEISCQYVAWCNSHCPHGNDGYHHAEFYIVGCTQGIWQAERQRPDKAGTNCMKDNNPLGNFRSFRS